MAERVVDFPQPTESTRPPLVPADCDLRDFPFMPLQVSRLRRSKAWLKAKRQPALAFYMVNLWTASWHDFPASSLENDQDVLADLAMCPPDKWAKVREDVLHGWILCSDGRLYNPTVAEQALEAWKAKTAQRTRTEAARVALAEKRRLAELARAEGEKGSVTETVTDPGTATVTDIATDSKGQRQGEGQGQGDLLPPKTPLLRADHPSADQAAVVEIEAVKRSIPDCPHQRVLRLWAELLPTLPQPVRWTDTRQGYLRARWKELFADKSQKVTTEEDALRWLAKYFRWIGKSDFLMGRAAARPNKPPFVAELQWVLQPENFTKVLEGKYHGDQEE